ncbi:Sodium/calcium exchanger protein-domain-containing protein [Delphinella strobiligena]|nr:Sodium/calcium exchanger protein-domain-containing protein [Delphinella strobiligena]
MHRIRSWARQHASEDTAGSTPQRSALPITSNSYRKKGDKSVNKTHNAGNTELPGPTVSLGNDPIININTDGPRDINTHNDANTTSASSPATAQPIKSEAAGETDSTINNAPGQINGAKLPITTRMKNGSKRFGQHTWDALTHSWVNVLLICVPAGIAVKAAGVNASVVFALNAVAIIPLAGMLAYATESVASRLGDTLGALLNVSFGNAVELIIFIIALVKNEIRIVQASLLGSILSNLLLILGMAFLLGGLRFQEQIYNNTVTQMSACLLSLAVTSLVLPTVFHASFSDTADADKNVLKISRGTSVVLLIVYVLYLAFQLKSHAYLYESTPQKIIDEESHPGILADLLDSSSSSSDSDTDSTNSSDTSGSHTTTKRIKRAFRNRRRRKSSVSSTNTVSLPSVISSPSVERPGSNWESQTISTAEPSRQNSHLGAIASGDEADIDGEDAPRGEPRVRDFVQHLHTISPPAEDSNRKKKHKKRRHKHSYRWDEKHDVVDEDSSIRKMGKKPSHSHDMPPTKVGFSDDIQPTADPSYQARRPFGLTFTRPSLRPALPKVLSQNVFISASGSPVINAATAPTTTSGLRRTSSLPDRLNRQGNAPASRGLASDNIPPFPTRSIAPDASSTAEHEDDEKPLMSRTSACFMLLISTGLVALCAEFMVDAIPEMLENSSVSQAFIGLIILPIVSNAAEHVTAVTVAAKNKMDLAIGVSVGSSIQIALFVTPLVVILGWILDKDMSLYFNLFETVSLFITTFLVNFLVLDGRSNYLEGSLLIAVYVIIAVSAFFYPDGSAQSSLGGGGSS